MSNNFRLYVRRSLAILVVAVMLAANVPALSASAASTSELGKTFRIIDSFQPNSETPEFQPEVRYGSAIVMDASSGAVLYEKAAYMQRPMASTTKIMTCLLAVESGDIGRSVTITEDMLAYDEEGSTKLGLKLGDTITMHDLVVAMFLLSGNDCAQAAAIELGGSFENFASMMNERASEIGMYDTFFETPSGLDLNAPNHHSTAYDMALLGIEAMKNEVFAELCGLRSYTVQFGGINYPLNTHNYLLEGQRRGVEGCDGIKTGYTDKAGYCLVSHVERDGVSLVCCTLGAYSYWDYHEQLYEYAFSKYLRLQPTPQVEDLRLSVIGGETREVPVYCYVDGTFSVHENQVDGVYSVVRLNSFEYAPITKDQVVGSVTYYHGTSELATYSIRASQNVDCITSNWLSAYIDAIKYDMESDE